MRGLNVFPVLIDGALLPRAAQLPHDLRPLVRRQAIALDYSKFDADVALLSRSIRKAIDRRSDPSGGGARADSGSSASGTSEGSPSGPVRSKPRSAAAWAALVAVVVGAGLALAAGWLSTRRSSVVDLPTAAARHEQRPVARPSSEPTALPPRDTSRPAHATSAAEQVSERTIRFGHTSSTEHPVSMGVKKFAELVAAKTGGKIAVMEFPLSQLGNETQRTVRAARRGSGVNGRSVAISRHSREGIRAGRLSFHRLQCSTGRCVLRWSRSGSY